MSSRDGADPPTTTRETRSKAPRPPQDTSTPPSTPSSATSELPPKTPKTPRDLANVIRACLSTAQASGKKPLQANYKDLFTLLDALRTSLDDKDILSASLNAFKSDLLTQIQSSLMRTNSAPSYSAVAANSARPSPTPTSATPTPSIAKTNEFIVALNAKSELLALPVATVRERVAAALAASGIPTLHEVELKGVKVLLHARLLVATHDEKSATHLKQTVSYWTPKLSKDSHLVVPSYRVVVNSVPKSFKPDSPHTAQELYAHDRMVITDPSVIKEVHWLNPKAFRDPKKLASSLLLTVTNIVTAVKSAICPTHRYEEAPTQCYNCQKYSHTQHHCKEPSPVCAC
ncbi:hypothetical protein K438DRAFT_1958979 [Mycena galopus ATCC 62051]|nr:hypothetical protein K438DRAFT_1958979 [Mycena galopus ATCC 62051]